MPWVNNWPLKTDLETYILRYEQPIVKGSRLILYKASQDGFQASFNRVKPHYETGINAGVEWIRISELSPELAKKIDFKPRLIDRKIPFIFAEPTLLFDCRDNKVSRLEVLFRLFR